jgi:hypothetical protein
LSIFGKVFAKREKSRNNSLNQVMKNVFTILLSTLACIQLSAQASAVVFSEAGEKFTVYLNGEKKNSTPQPNVKIQGLTSDFYQARIDFEDAMLLDFSEGNFAVQRGSEVTYVVKRNKKGEFVLRYYGQTDGVVEEVAKESNAEVKSFAEVDDTEHHSEDVQINQTISIQEQPVAKTTVTQTTTTTTKAQPTKAAPATGGNVSMGINVDGVNMGISINASEMGGSMDMNMDVEETQHTTITTTTTTTTSQPEPAPKPAPKPAAKPAPAPAPAPAPVAAPAKPTGRCASSMAPASFTKAKDNISSSSFEDSKMTVAKQVTKANCLTAAQVAEVMGLFSFEDSKLQYAKYAYDFCFNQGDYYEVNTAFTFESSIEDLNQYLESK